MADGALIFDTGIDPKGIEKGLDDLERTTKKGAEKVRREMDEASDSARRIGKQAEKSEGRVKASCSKMGRYARTLAKGFSVAVGAVAAGLGVLAKKAVSYNSDMEDYVTNFGVMLGSQEAAVKKVAELKEFAAKTPFGMDELARATQTMLSFGMANDKARDALSMLGDIAMGDKEKLSSLSLAFAQLSSAGKLTGQDLLQMINAGFNPLQAIADKTGASIGDLKDVMGGGKGSKAFQQQVKAAKAEVKRLGDGADDGARMLARIGTEGQISAELVEESMRIATGEGGLFFQGMEKASKSLSGQWSTFKDDAMALAGEAFAPLSNSLSKNVMPLAQGYLAQLTEALKVGGAEGLAGALGDVLGDAAAHASACAPQLVKLSVGLIDHLVKGLGKNGKKIAAGVVAALANGVKGLAQSAPQLARTALSLLTSLAAGIAEAAPEVIPDLMEGLVDILVALCENTDDLLAAGAALAGGVVKGALKAIPKLASGLWNALTALFTHQDEIRDAVEAECADMAEAYDRLKQNIAKTDEKYQTTVKDVGTNAATAETLLTLYEQLDAKDNKTDADMAEMAAIASQIKEVYPNIAQFINPVTGLFTVSTAAIRNNIQALKDQAMAAAYLDAMKEKAGELVDTNDQIETAQEALANATAQKGAYEEYERYLNALQEQWRNGGVDFGHLGSEFADFIENSEANTLRSMYDKQGDGSYRLREGSDPTTAQTAADTTWTGVLGWNDERIKTEQGVIEQNNETLTGLLETRARLNAEIEKYARLSTGEGTASAKQAENAKATAAALKEQLESKKEERKIRDLLGGKKSEDYITFSSLMTGIPDAAADSAAWVAWQTALDALIEKYPKLKEYLDDLLPSAQALTDATEGSGKADTLATQSAATDVAGAAQAYTDGAESVGSSREAALTPSPEEAAPTPVTDAAEADIDGAVKVIDEQTPALQTKGLEAGNALASGFAGNTGEEMPDTDSESGMTALADQLMDTLADGITESDAPRAAVYSSVSAAITAGRKLATDRSTGGYDIGRQIVQGIASGARSKTSLLNDALREIIREALKAAQNEAGIKSPSRLFRDEVGAYIALGIGEGVTETMRRTVAPGIGREIAGSAAASMRLIGEPQAAELPDDAGSFYQTINFHAPMQAPDEIARAVRRQARYGLAGDRR